MSQCLSQPNAVWHSPSAPSVLNNRTTALTCYEAFKFLIPFLLLLPLRLLLITVALFNLWLWCRLCILGLSSAALAQTPLSKARRRLLVPARWSARLFLLGLGYWHIHTKGQRSRSARIIVANHLSFVEAAAMVCSGRASFVSRKENEALPVVYAALKAFQCISVDRADPNSRKAVAEAIQRRATTPGWPPVIIFPEGTTGNGTGLMAFKVGAFTPLLPVQPCCVRFAYEHFDPSFSIGASLPGLGLRSLAQWYNSLTLDWLEPVAPQPAGGDPEQGPPDPKRFCAHVRELMGKRLGVPLVLESYQDVQLRLEAAKLKVPNKTPLIQVDWAVENFGLDLPGLTALLRGFAQRYGGACRVSYSVLQRGLSLPACPLLHGLFEALDVDRDGAVSFADYVEGCYRLDRELSQLEALPRLMDRLGRNGRCCVSKEDVAASFKSRFSDLKPHHADALWKLVAATDPSAAAAAASLFGHPHRLGVAAASSPAVPEANSVPATAFQSFLINHLEYFFLLHAISSPTPTP
eukprot:EG_transcript_5975